MDKNEQKTRKGPRPFTPEERDALMKSRKMHEEKIKTDPEYKKQWEKRMRLIRAIEHIED